MFSGCTSLQSLNLSNFNTSQVTTMTAMFSYCTSLQSLNLSNFNTSQVTQMDYMFEAISSLQSLDLSNFNTSKLYNINYMFIECFSLKSLDLSNFNTLKVSNCDEVFQDSSSLEYINLFNYYGIDIFTKFQINNNLMICLKNYSQFINEESVFKTNNVTIRCNIMYIMHYCSCLSKNLNFGIKTNNEIIEFEKEIDNSCVWNSYIKIDYLSQFRYIIYSKPRDIYIILKYSQYITYDNKELEQLINTKTLLKFQQECNLKRLDDSNSLLIITKLK